MYSLNFFDIIYGIIIHISFEFEFSDVNRVFRLRNINFIKVETIPKKNLNYPYFIYILNQTYIHLSINCLYREELL